MKLGETQEFASPEEALAHHGVKGMRWGVRNEDDLVGESSSAASATAYHKLAEDIAGRAGIDSHLAAAKYGPSSMQARVVEAQRQADREKLKKAAIFGGVALGAAAAGVAIYKINQAGGFDNLPGMDFKKQIKLFGTNQKAYANAVDGLNLNWEHGVSLPKGSIIRRLSSVAETVPRPEGFYAAHLDSDVDSYKAILPTFWKQWGVGNAKAGGFLNHYQAKGAIKAPSGKESFELFQKLIHTDDDFNAHFVSIFSPHGIRDLSEADLKLHFVDSSINWADKNNEFTQHWFREVRSRGFNALIDFNDAGKLGKTPIRVLDGNMFDIVKNEPQSLNDFYSAAKKWTPELVHLFTRLTGEAVVIHVDDFLRAAEMGREFIAMLDR